MLKNEKLINKSSSVDQPSHQSSTKVIRDGVTTNRQRSRVLIKTSNTPSLELERNLPECYTPYTSLSDYFPDLLDNSRQPDLTLKCRKCLNYINLDDLNDHTDLHIAMDYFNLIDINILTLDQLNNKRIEFAKGLLNKCLRKSTKDLGSNKTYEWRTKFNQLNNYYELLKSYISNRFESTRQLKRKNLKLDSRGQSWIGLNDLIISIGSCSNQNSSHRIEMEDTSIILDNFGENRNLVYIGVFDGYDGDVASRRCSSQLHLSILDHLANRLDGDEVKFTKEAFEFDEINNLERYEKERGNEVVVVEEEKEEEAKENNQDPENSSDSIDDVYRQSLKRAYQRMDILLARGKGESSKVRWSGVTSCNCVLINNEEGGLVHIANCGDVEAIVVYDGSKITPNYLRRNYKLLTKLHTINSCLKDRDYIERKGCNLLETSTGEKKICGLYSITRGLGFHGDKHVKKFISTKPSVSTYKLEAHYSALIIATKGLWSVLSYEQVAELVLQSLPSSEKKFKYERAVSPSVRALITSNKEKLTDRSNLLHTVHDKEVGAVPMERFNESSETSIESNTIKKTYSAVDDESDSSDNATQPRQQQDKTEIIKRRPRTEPTSPREKLDKRNCNSDIYPYRIENPIMTEIEDDRIDLISVDKLYLKPESAQEASKMQDQVKAALKPTSVHVVQVDEYELNKFERANMENSETARRLELAESLSEMLTNVALLAGSTDNITVNCILLSGAFN